MIKSILLGVVGSLVFLLTFVKSIFFRKVRLRLLEGQALYNEIRKRGRNFILQEEYTDSNILPKVFLSLTFFRWMFLFVSVEERILQAGMSGTDNVMVITFFRWNYKRLLFHLEKTREVNTSIPVFIMKP